MPRPNVSANRGQMGYNTPAWSVSGGNVVQANKPDIGEQIRLEQLLRQVMVDLRHKRYFSQLSGVYNLAHHTGKKIKQMHQLPLLDARNINNQGIDGQGRPSTDPNNLYNKGGNLYGDSLDFNDMANSMPFLSEVGGRVHRVGFTRQTIEGEIHDLGFYYEYTQDLLTFNDDPMLLKHMATEAIEGAHNIQEDLVAQDLIQAAGHKYYTGMAVDLGSMSAEGAIPSKLTYRDLSRLAVALKDAKAPNILKASTGSTNVDTRIIGSGYAIYAHYDLENQLRDMTDSYGNPAFIPVEKYASSTSILIGEIGAIGQFRIISVPRMPMFRGAGAEDVGSDSSYQTSKGRTAAEGGYGTNNDPAKDYYDVYPIMAVASEAFTSLGLQASTRKGVGNFKIITKLPSEETATAHEDPYGRTGFTSIQWTHGILIRRPEWIAVIYTVCEL